MSTQFLTKTKVTPQSTPSFTPVRSNVLQRRCACGGTPGPDGECAECRRKRMIGPPPRLVVNQPGDRSEQEADRMADQAMPRPATNVERRTSAPTEGTTAPPIVHEVLGLSGQPLDANTRSSMEPRFGHNFSQVRVHNDEQAAQSARAVDALAYTVGRDVVFGAGQYAPGTMDGRKLLAHELAHVVQQRNATYPVGGLTLADSTREREADAAAEAAVRGRPAHVARHTAGPQLARQQCTEKQTTELDAARRKIEVTRTVEPGLCAEIPVTRKSSDSEITRTRAAISVSYCRGRTRAGASGEIDYSDVSNTIKQAVQSAPNFLSNPNQQAINDLEQAFKRIAPRANVRFDLQVGGTKVEVTGTGTASVEGGVSGKAGAAVSGRVGKTGVKGGVEVSGGTQEEEKVIFTGTFTPGAGPVEEPHCFECTCLDPTITYECFVHETPGEPKQPPRPLVLHVPLFFEYKDVVPRKGREKDYEKALGDVVKLVREGYTIARIEGSTSPEGPLKGGPGFEEGNIGLAQSRAEEAKRDLDVALSKAVGKEEVKFRDRNEDTIRRLKAARSAAIDVKGLAPGGDTSSAELFGTSEKGEVTERDMLEHLKKTLKKPKEGERDPLAEAHVTGEGLPPDVRAEVEAEVKVFREGKRGGKNLEDRDRLETIYKPLRRALIVLNPPKLKGEKESVELVEARRKKGDCPPNPESLFKPYPESCRYKGHCRPKEGGVGGKVK